MIYKTTAYNSKTNHHYANNPKTYKGKVTHARTCAHTHARARARTHTHTHTHTHKELTPNNHAMTFNTTSITVLVLAQHVSTYRALQFV